MIPQTYHLEELVPKPFPSEDWIRRKLSAGEFTGIKIGKRWVMTAKDVSDALEHMRKPQESGQTTASMRRRRSA